MLQSLAYAIVVPKQGDYMENLTLRDGDLVVFRLETKASQAMGLKYGQYYRVWEGLDQSLIVKSSTGHVAVLVGHDGTLTDWSDHFALYRCPVELPRGVDQD